MAEEAAPVPGLCSPQPRGTVTTTQQISYCGYYTVTSTPQPRHAHRRLQQGDRQGEGAGAQILLQSGGEDNMRPEDQKCSAGGVMRYLLTTAHVADLCVLSRSS